MTEVRTVSVENLDGHCVVLHKKRIVNIDAWIEMDDHFFVSDRAICADPRSPDDLHELSCRDFHWCKACWSSRQEQIDQEEEFKETTGGLRTLELFAGMDWFLCLCAVLERELLQVLAGYLPEWSFPVLSK